MVSNRPTPAPSTLTAALYANRDAAYLAEESARVAFEAIGGDSTCTDSANPFTIALYAGNDEYEAWLCARAAVRFWDEKVNAIEVAS